MKKKNKTEVKKDEDSHLNDVAVSNNKLFEALVVIDLKLDKLVQVLQDIHDMTLDAAQKQIEKDNGGRNALRN